MTTEMAIEELRSELAELAAREAAYGAALDREGSKGAAQYRYGEAEAYGKAADRCAEILQKFA